MNRRHRLAAGILAAPAGVGADAAMFVDLAVMTALLGADMAGERAGLEQRAHDREIFAGTPRRHARQGEAEVGAIEIAADALPQAFDIGLGQTGVGADGAGFGAGMALHHALGQRLAVTDGGGVRMGAEHRAHGHGDLRGNNACECGTGGVGASSLAWLADLDRPAYFT